jgi:hypothetical protein
MWEIFKLQGESAINSIQTSGAINNLAAGIMATLDFGARKENGGNQNWKESFKKYQQYGIEANVEIADSLDARIEEIGERQKSRMADAAKQMAAEEEKLDQQKEERQKRMAEASAKAATELAFKNAAASPKNMISEKLDWTKFADKWLDEGPKAAKKIEQSLKEGAKSLADSAWESINAAKESDRIDPGGRMQKRIDDALGKGQFGVAERAGNRLDRREQEQRIQDAFGNGDRKLKKSLAEIAKEQGIDTKGKSSKDLRKALDDLIKKRGEELAPGKGGKKGDEAKPPAKPKAEDMLLKAVQTIEKLVAKIEPKLPTHALGA